MSKDNGAKMAESPKLLDLLEASTAADLAEIDQQIAAIEGEREAALAGFYRRLTSLRAVRRIMDMKVNGQKARKKRVPKAKAPGEQPDPSSAETMGKRLRIAQLLGRDGRLLSTQIAARLGFPDARSVGNLLQHDWFDRSANGVRLSAKGRQGSGV